MATTRPLFDPESSPDPLMAQSPLPPMDADTVRRKVLESTPTRKRIGASATPRKSMIQIVSPTKTTMTTTTMAGGSPWRINVMVEAVPENDVQGASPKRKTPAKRARRVSKMDTTTTTTVVPINFGDTPETGAAKPTARKKRVATPRKPKETEIIAKAKATPKAASRRRKAASQPVEEEQQQQEQQQKEREATIPVVDMTAAQESQNISLSPLAPVERHIDSVNSSRADDRTSKSQTGTSSRLGKTLTPDTDPGFDHDGASDGDDGEDVFGNLSRELHAQVVVTAPSEDDIWVNAGRDSVNNSVLQNPSPSPTPTPKKPEPSPNTSITGTAAPAMKSLQSSAPVVTRTSPSVSRQTSVVAERNSRASSSRSVIAAVCVNPTVINREEYEPVSFSSTGSGSNTSAVKEPAPAPVPQSATRPSRPISRRKSPTPVPATLPAVTPATHITGTPCTPSAPLPRPRRRPTPDLTPVTAAVASFSKALEIGSESLTRLEFGTPLSEKEEQRPLRGGARHVSVGMEEDEEVHREIEESISRYLSSRSSMSLSPIRGYTPAPDLGLMGGKANPSAEVSYPTLVTEEEANRTAATHAIIQETLATIVSPLRISSPPAEATPRGEWKAPSRSGSLEPGRRENAFDSTTPVLIPKRRASLVQEPAAKKQKAEPAHEAGPEPDTSTLVPTLPLPDSTTHTTSSAATDSGYTTTRSHSHPLADSTVGRRRLLARIAEEREEDMQEGQEEEDTHMGDATEDFTRVLPESYMDVDTHAHHDETTVANQETIIIDYPDLPTCLSHLDPDTLPKIQPNTPWTNTHWSLLNKLLSALPPTAQILPANPTRMRIPRLALEKRSPQGAPLWNPAIRYKYFTVGEEAVVQWMSEVAGYEVGDLRRRVLGLWGGSVRRGIRGERCGRYGAGRWKEVGARGE